MAQILSGAPAAEALTAGLTVRSRALRERGITPTLVILRVGAQEESRSYERAAKKACTAAGVEAFTIELPENAHMDAVLHAVRSINAEPGVHGRCCRPMPFKKTERAACELAAARTWTA
ncbi:MAG: tetrahydrofolate dehydrogenase/cyclohydrolase catalytic domain-containing protein [Oscillospiraceae bacterium]